jgi:signal transduction histidine kinase
VAPAWTPPCAWPPALGYLRTLCAADEVASILRHEALNEIAGLGALVFRLRRRIEARLTVDGDLQQVLDTLETRLTNSQARLAANFLPAAALNARADFVALLSELPARMGIAAEVESALLPAEPRELAIDGDELCVAVGCLLENAAESLARAGSTQPVSVRLRGDRERRLIEVVDAGAGVDTAVLERLLDPFFTTRPDGGGLGLKIARRIAHRWNGELLVAPALPRGLTVQMVLPTPS